MSTRTSTATPRIEKLTKSHDIETFDCRIAPLNTYLKRFALVNQSAGAAQTYVATLGETVVGYYCLSTGSVQYDEAPERTRKGLARHPVPIILLGRLAVDRTWQGKGLGAVLLFDALHRVAGAADIIGVRALLAHAKDDTARQFYEHFNFEASSIEPLHMYLLIKDIVRLMKLTNP